MYYRNSFLPVDQLKQMIVQKKDNGEGWPTCILNVSAAQEYRPNVDGTLSLFTNISGRSLCKTSHQPTTIEKGQFFLTNSEQKYTLTIDELEPTETFNIHFGKDLIAQTFSGLTTGVDYILSNQKHETVPELYSKLYHFTPSLNQKITALYQKGTLKNEEVNPDSLYYTEVSSILEEIFLYHKDVLKEVAKIPSVKNSTKKELYKRLSGSIDYMQSNFGRKISIEELAQISMLSKYHYLRLFKEVFGIPPHQYLMQLRISKAKEALKHSKQPIAEIGSMVGFFDKSSFSRSFKKVMKVSPANYRIANI